MSNTHYPAGLHRINALIDTPAIQGWRINGDGPCSVIDLSPMTGWISGTTTRLRYEGRKETIMMRARGANWTIANLALLGNDSAEVNALRVAEKGGAFGGSMGTVYNVAFAGFHEAIRIGDTVDDTGNDNHHFEQIGFASCGAAFVIGARQAMHLSGKRWNTRWCESLVKVEAGGKFFLDGLDTDCAGTLLHTVGTARDLAPNNAIYKFTNVTVDAGANAKTLTLVNQEQPHWMRATFEDVWLPLGPYEVEATLRGPDSLLRLYRMENLPAATRFTLHDGATVEIHDSVLPIPAAQMLTPGSKGTIRLRGCTEAARDFSAKGRSLRGVTR